MEIAHTKIKDAATYAKVRQGPDIEKWIVKVQDKATVEVYTKPDGTLQIFILANGGGMLTGFDGKTYGCIATKGGEK